MQLNDTILAVSSPQGPGGIRAIVRLSGPESWPLAQSVARFPGVPAAGWQDVMYEFDGLSVAGNVLLFEEPQSFTGENVAELHLPASPALLGMLTQALLRGGATNVRMAQPGEFSARAFFNGKMDLTEAEGIAATISAGSETELRAAASLRGGDLHRWASATAERLANLLALVEAGIDFTEEEDVRFIQVPQLKQALAEMLRDIRRQLEAAVRIDRLEAPPTVVFVGKPNVGKSSLINALAGRERSIVSPVAGTTRDMLAAEMTAVGVTLRLIDVPGEEEPADELREKMMAARAAALLEADLVLEVFAAPDLPDFKRHERGVAIVNKVDLLADRRPLAAEAWQAVSAKSGEHIAELRAALVRMASHVETAGGSRLVLNQRHREILGQTLDLLGRAEEIVEAENRPELLAAELRHGLDLLGQMTGMISPDDVLGRVFSQFCIGK